MFGMRKLAGLDVIRLMGNYSLGNFSEGWFVGKTNHKWLLVQCEGPKSDVVDIKI